MTTNDSVTLIKAEQILNGWAAEEGNFHESALAVAQSYIVMRKALERFVDIYSGHNEGMHGKDGAGACSVCSARALLLR